MYFFKVNSKLWLLTFMLILSYEAKAQSDQEKIKATFYEYAGIMQDMTNPKILDYIYPGFFDYVPRVKMEKSLEIAAEAFNNPQVKITAKDIKADKVSKVIKVRGVKYALLGYSMKMQIQFFDEGGSPKAVEDEIFEVYKMKYGKKNISINKEKSIITVGLQEELYMINDSDYENKWFFITKKERLEEIIEDIIPTKVLKKLK